MRPGEIPADQSIWTEYGRLIQVNLQRTREILEEADRAPATPEARKLGDFHASLMNEAGIEAQGLAPLQVELARIDAVRTAADLARAPRTSPGWRPLGLRCAWDRIAAGVFWDLTHPSRYLPSLNQGGLGVPDRDYYLGDSPAFATIREAYRAHLTKLFQIAGMSYQVQPSNFFSIEFFAYTAIPEWNGKKLRIPWKTMASSPTVGSSGSTRPIRGFCR